MILKILRYFRLSNKALALSGQREISPNSTTQQHIKTNTQNLFGASPWSMLLLLKNWLPHKSLNRKKPHRKSVLLIRWWLQICTRFLIEYPRTTRGLTPHYYRSLWDHICREHYWRMQLSFFWSTHYRYSYMWPQWGAMMSHPESRVDSRTGKLICQAARDMYRQYGRNAWVGEGNGLVWKIKQAKG